MKKHEFTFNGYNATVLVPDNFNGKWLWKTEFFYAFDKAEQTLLNMGYARVYYQISNMYGSDRAVRLMHKFHLHLTEKFGFTEDLVFSGFQEAVFMLLTTRFITPNMWIKSISTRPFSTLNRGRRKIVQSIFSY